MNDENENPTHPDELRAFVAETMADLEAEAERGEPEAENIPHELQRRVLERFPDLESTLVEREGLEERIQEAMALILDHGAPLIRRLGGELTVLVEFPTPEGALLRFGSTHSIDAVATSFVVTAGKILEGGAKHYTTHATPEALN